MINIPPLNWTELAQKSVGSVAGQQGLQGRKRIGFGQQQQQRRWAHRGFVGRRRRQFLQHNSRDSAVAVFGWLPRWRLHAKSRTDLLGSYGRRSSKSSLSSSPSPASSPSGSPVPVASRSASRRSRSCRCRAPPKHFGHVSDQPGSRLARLSSPGIDGHSVVVAASLSSPPPPSPSSPARPNATGSTAAKQFECVPTAAQWTLVKTISVKWYIY